LYRELRRRLDSTCGESFLEAAGYNLPCHKPFDLVRANCGAAAVNTPSAAIFRVHSCQTVTEAYWGSRWNWCHRDSSLENDFEATYDSDLP
jgi:hypothetical protein